MFASVCVYESESMLLTKTKLPSPPDTQTVQPQSRNSLMCDNNSWTSPKKTYNTTMILWWCQKGVARMYKRDLITKRKNMSFVLSEVCRSGEKCRRVTARYLPIADNFINSFRQCDIFSVKCISPPDSFELRWIYLMGYTYAICVKVCESSASCTEGTRKHICIAKSKCHWNSGHVLLIIH